MQSSYTPSQSIQQSAQEKNIVSPVSREPGRVPSQVPSADLEKIVYQHHKLWNPRNWRAA